MAEDADLTISVHRAGYKVLFQENAIAATEAPTRVRPFMRQRLRWVLGMLQSGWKHKRALTEFRPVGLISIFDFLFVGTLNQLLAPIVDLVLVASIVSLMADAVAGQPILSPTTSLMTIASYMVLPVLDILLAVAAFRFAKNENWSLMLLVPLQRFCYRQLLYITVYRAIGRAISGQLAQWQKPERVAAKGAQQL
jgi:cellulose synthase/poly-beta-1,6-N-acetylglucosamine synthase-like glycosyltransferase